MGKSYGRGFFISDGIFKEGSVGCEIGIFRAGFANSVVNKTNPKMYHMIDPWQWRRGWKRHDYKGTRLTSQEVVEWMVKDIYKRFDLPNVTIHRDFSYNVVDQFEDHYFDYVYVDGDHNYFNVLKDLRLYYPKIKPGGIMSGDDWNIKGNRVKNAVWDFADEIGIKRNRINVRSGQFWFRKNRE